MIKIDNEKDILNELKKNRKFLATHDVIRNFSKICDLNDQLCDFDYDMFSSMTKKNLRNMSELLNCTWKYTIRYSVGKRYGYLVYGITENQVLVNFHRKETNSTGAGQTIIHIGKKDLQVHRILKNEFKGELELNLLKKLVEHTQSLHLEKMLFERM